VEDGQRVVEERGRVAAGLGQVAPGERAEILVARLKKLAGVFVVEVEGEETGASIHEINAADMPDILRQRPLTSRLLLRYKPTVLLLDVWKIIFSRSIQQPRISLPEQPSEIKWSITVTSYRACPAFAQVNLADGFGLVR
jgi:hypothetical protein